MSVAAITLPGGYWSAGQCHRTATVRGLSGADEAFLAGEGASMHPAARATAVIARCLVELGGTRPDEAARGLTAGDREAMLLHIRRLTLGSRMDLVLRCPACREPMDLEVDAESLLVSPYPDPRPYYEAAFDEDDGGGGVRFRLPDGADLEEAAAIAQHDVDGAALRLLRRCVLDPADGPLPAAVWEQLPARMAELDPQAEIVLDVACPACGHGFAALFDTADFFFRELAGRLENVYREVHTLAFYYHWSEAEILAMAPARRRRYLGLIEEALGGAR